MGIEAITGEKCPPAQGPCPSTVQHQHRTAPHCAHSSECLPQSTLKLDQVDPRPPALPPGRPISSLSFASLPQLPPTPSLHSLPQLTDARKQPASRSSILLIAAHPSIPELSLSFINSHYPRFCPLSVFVDCWSFNHPRFRECSPLPPPRQPILRLAQPLTTYLPSLILISNSTSTVQPLLPPTTTHDTTNNTTTIESVTITSSPCRCRKSPRRRCSSASSRRGEKQSR